MSLESWQYDVFFVVFLSLGVIVLLWFVVLAVIYTSLLLSEWAENRERRRKDP